MRPFVITIDGLAHIALARSSCSAVCDAMDLHPGARSISAKALAQRP